MSRVPLMNKDGSALLQLMLFRLTKGARPLNMRAWRLIRLAYAMGKVQGADNFPRLRDFREARNSCLEDWHKAVDVVD